MLTPGEKLWNGNIVSRYLAAAYNSLTAKINAYEAAGLPVPEAILNARHNLIAG